MESHTQKKSLKETLKNFHVSFRPGFDADKDWFAISTLFALCVLLSVGFYVFLFLKLNPKIEQSDARQNSELIDKNQLLNVIEASSQKAKQFDALTGTIIDAPRKPDIVESQQ